MGRALARLMAERGDALFLLGRDADDLERSAARPGGARRPRHAVGTAALRPRTARDVRPGARRGESRRSAASTRSSSPARLFATQDAARSGPRADPPRAHGGLREHRRLLRGSARRRLLDRGGGTLCVFSSVAGDRGRKPVVLYGAAKAGLVALPRRARPPVSRGGPAVVCVKPGFVKTSMTRGAAAPPFAGDARGRGRSRRSRPSTGARP